MSAFPISAVHCQSPPISFAHAHNDYLHSHPLYDALQNGFTSIEADVYLHNGKLVVSHLPFGLNSKKTLEELYLDSLKEIIQTNGGSVFKDTAVVLMLMIDFKTSAEKTYPVLVELLSRYKGMIALYRENQIIQDAPVRVLISGSAPVNELRDTKESLATVDLPISKADDSVSLRVATRFSSSWGSYFTWQGKGEMPEKQYQVLLALVEKVHKHGCQIRFYHIPDKPKVWKVLIAAGVDWINTDKLSLFSDFAQKLN